MYVHFTDYHENAVVEVRRMEDYTNGGNISRHEGGGGWTAKDLNVF